MQKNNVYIPSNQHVFIGGRTGSGKTFLARNYLAGYDNVVLLDTKGTTIWPEIPGTVWKDFELVEGPEEIALVTTLEECIKLDPEKVKKIIYRPVWGEMNQETYDHFFQWIYLRKNCIVWIDESMSISPNFQRIPDYYKACLTRGRELNIGVWSLSQRPSGLANIIISESSHIFSFDLNMPQDREKITSVTGAAEFLEKPGKYMFWYYYVEWENAVKGKLVRR